MTKGIHYRKKMHLCIFINFSSNYCKCTTYWATSIWICSGEKCYFQGLREKPQGITLLWKGKNMFNHFIYQIFFFQRWLLEQNRRYPSNIQPRFLFFIHLVAINLSRGAGIRNLRVLLKTQVDFILGNSIDGFYDSIEQNILIFFR